jgi:hypothetical protein
MVIERWKQYSSELLDNSETQTKEENVNPKAELYIIVQTTN